MGRLIIHADDFGLTETINEGIIHAYTKGIVTSTSIAANGSAFKHAVELHRLNPKLDVGIHLTLIEEWPLLETNQISSLVNQNGQFHQHAITFVKKYLTKKICPKEIEHELEAQIKKVIDYGIRISHVDSHQHLHVLPGIVSIILNLMEKYNIPAIRLPCEKINLRIMMSSGVSFTRVIHLVILNLLCSKVKNRPALHTDYFAGFLYSGCLHKKNFERLINHLPRHGTCEIMCHPGMDTQNIHYGHWRYHWSDELMALTDPKISNLIRQKGFQLTSYQDLNVK